MMHRIRWEMGDLTPKVHNYHKGGNLLDPVSNSV